MIVASSPSKAILASGEKSLALARRVLNIEADAVRTLIDRIGGGLLAAPELILSSKGRVVVSGLGKSGPIARKLWSNLARTGTTASFVDLAEPHAGDPGNVSPWGGSTWCP